MNDDVAALMLTNPNTLGIFEKNILRIAEIVHQRGGLVYMDGANLNALMGLTRPGDFGIDVMHMNLHKDHVNAARWRRARRRTRGDQEDPGAVISPLPQLSGAICKASTFSITIGHAQLAKVKGLLRQLWNLGSCPLLISWPTGRTDFEKRAQWLC